MIWLSSTADAGPLLDAGGRLAVPLTLVDLGDQPELRPRYGADLLLVRPDQHVAWRGDAADDPTPCWPW